MAHGLGQRDSEAGAGTRPKDSRDPQELGWEGEAAVNRKGGPQATLPTCPEPCEWWSRDPPPAGRQLSLGPHVNSCSSTWVVQEGLGSPWGGQTGREHSNYKALQVRLRGLSLGSVLGSDALVFPEPS